MTRMVFTWRKRSRWLVLCAGLLLWTGIIWANSTGSGYFLTAGKAVLIDPHDLNGDGFLESYLLTGHSLKIVENERTLWESPAEWRVASVAIGDVNHDNREDLLMMVWKKGSFGKELPFWILENDRKVRCHLFVYDLLGDRVKPVWMSSALARPIKSFQIKDINQDGKNELIVQESSYSLLSCLLHSEASPAVIMQWQGWGFTQLD